MVNGKIKPAKLIQAVYFIEIKICNYEKKEVCGFAGWEPKGLTDVDIIQSTNFRGQKSLKILFILSQISEGADYLFG